MSHPKLGMYYSDVRRRIKRIAKDFKTNPHSNKEQQIRLADSLINQAVGHSGKGAKEELLKELDTNKHSTNKLGWSSRYGNAWDKLFKV